MLGWDVYVIRPREPLSGLDDPRLDPSSEDFTALYSSPVLAGDTLASWSAQPAGLDWLDESADGEPVSCRQLSFGGYPNVYAVAAEIVLTSVDPGQLKWPYSDTPRQLDLSAVAAIPSDEWLLIAAWDQS